MLGKKWKSVSGAAVIMQRPDRREASEALYSRPQVLKPTILERCVALCARLLCKQHLGLPSESALTTKSTRAGRASPLGRKIRDLLCLRAVQEVRSARENLLTQPGPSLHFLPFHVRPKVGAVQQALHLRLTSLFLALHTQDRRCTSMMMILIRPNLQLFTRIVHLHQQREPP